MNRLLLKHLLINTAPSKMSKVQDFVREKRALSSFIFWEKRNGLLQSSFKKILECFKFFVAASVQLQEFSL